MKFNPIKTKLRALAIPALFAVVPSMGLAGGGFSVTSPAFEDNDLLDSRYAAKGGPRKCDGENVSPPLAWSNIPEGTQSFAMIVHDAVGAHGLGVTHWVGYGIPADASGIPEGGINTDGNYVGGINRIKKSTWFGPCPSVGDVPHHYEFTLIATDLAPDALAPGLTRTALLEALSGHALAATSTVARYAR